MDIVKYIFSLKWLSDLIYEIKVTVCVCVCVCVCSLQAATTMDLQCSNLAWSTTYTSGRLEDTFRSGTPYPQGRGRPNFLLFFRPANGFLLASSFQNHLLCHQWLGLNSLAQIVRFCWFCLSKFNSPFDRFGSHHILLFKLKH